MDSPDNEFEILYDPDHHQKLGTEHLYMIKVPNEIMAGFTLSREGLPYLYFAGKRDDTNRFVATISTLFRKLCSKGGRVFDPYRGFYVTTLDEKK